jgi:hypothetical protein
MRRNRSLGHLARQRLPFATTAAIRSWSLLSSVNPSLMLSPDFTADQSSDDMDEVRNRAFKRRGVPHADEYLFRLYGSHARRSTPGQPTCPE